MTLLGGRMQILSYARSDRRRGWRLPAMLILIVSAMYLIQGRFGLLDSIESEYSKWRCENFAASKGHVALEFDPVLARGLLDSASDYIVDPSIQSSPSPRALYVPGTLQKYSAYAVCPSQATLFMHQRTSRGGTTRLVVVLAQLHDHDEPSRPRVSLDVLDAESPKAIVHDMGEELWIDPWAGVIARSLQTPLENRIFSGVHDPADASHFTIDYILWGISDTIDGWLRDDGTVSLRARHGNLIRRDVFLPID